MNEKIFEVYGAKGFNAYSAVFVKAENSEQAIEKALLTFEEFYKDITEEYRRKEVDFGVNDIFKETDTYFTCG